MTVKFKRHIFITGANKGLGFHLYKNISFMENSKITIIGRSSHPNINKKDPMPI